MLKNVEEWSVTKLRQDFAQISFPEYQREPSVWSRAAKQRLVDSMIRQFDIASVYFYVDEVESIECIDGRQRLNAILSFMNLNPEDVDDGFEYKVINEIYAEVGGARFQALDGMTYAIIAARAETKEGALEQQFLAEFSRYCITVVRLSNAEKEEEFNLQFTRLNLGTIINSGEKLHAMVGDLRNTCFGPAALGSHPLLSRSIPARRYAKEQVAAQLLAQWFSWRETKLFTRTRHFDLQRLFKQHETLTPVSREWIEEVRRTLDLLVDSLDERSMPKNRAIAVSVVLLALLAGIDTPTLASDLAAYLAQFMCRLKWQTKKGLDVDQEYRYLIDFQRHVTQASVEKPAVAARASTLAEGLHFWRQHRSIRGDVEYVARTSRNPEVECQGVDRGEATSPA